jgi:hypothetical protein
VTEKWSQYQHSGIPSVASRNQTLKSAIFPPQFFTRLFLILMMGGL